MYLDLKEQEAAAVRQIPPELAGHDNQDAVDADARRAQVPAPEVAGIETSDGNKLSNQVRELAAAGQNDQEEDEDSDNGVVVEQKGLKRLFKQIVKNANSKDKVDVNKEYAPLMKKYMERTE